MSEEQPRQPWNSSNNPWLRRIPKKGPIQKRQSNQYPPGHRSPITGHKSGSPRPGTTSPDQKSSKPPVSTELAHPLLKPLLHAIREGTRPPRGLRISLLTGTVKIDGDKTTPLHFAAAKGRLGSFPDDLLCAEMMLLQDANGRTPLHLAVSCGTFDKVPRHLLEYLTKEVFLACDNNGLSLADIVEEYGNTPLLPAHLQWLSRVRALAKLGSLFRLHFLDAETFWKKHLECVISQSEFQAIRNQFVRDWSRTHFEHALDEEQAEAVIASGCDLLLSARAGSGKTGTLVARTLFEMEIRGVDPRKMMILAFNKNAALEVRERLAKVTGEERCPYVMTFHSLAYRLVHPVKDSILKDEKDSEEGQTLSQTLNNLIDDEIRLGKLVEEIRKIMAFRWDGDWNEIVNSGGLLPQGELLTFREARQFHAIDGRYLDTAMEKVVADELVRRGKKYAHRPVVYQRSGNCYAPAFSVLEGGRRVIIDIEGTADPGCLRAREIYWNADRSSGAVWIDLQDSERCGGIEQFRKRLITSLESDDIGWKPLSEDQIWEQIKFREISNFTRSVAMFIARCQKELWTPEVLASHITEHERELQRKKPQENLILEASVLFWRVCHQLFITYLDRLAKLGKTDFDHLMMDAASSIRQGKTRFGSQWNSGDLAEVEHVFVDEYQDFSHLFNELLKAIQEINPRVRFFCVGDDWQAINGFAGSNLQYFQGFPEMFPGSRKLEILKNYRSAPEIVHLGNRVMAGKGSPSEPARGIKGRVCQIFAGSSEKANGDWEECVEDQLGAKAVPLLKLISRSMQESKSLLVLFRNRTVWTSSQSLNLQDYRKKLLSWLEEDPKEQLVFSTTHSYKGGEADHVIVMDPEAYPLLHENCIFNLIFGETEATLIEDERRLFYVGVTRAKVQLVFLREQQTQILLGRQVPIHIQFLREAPLETISLVSIASPVFPGERCLVRISCGVTDLGPQIRKAGFLYREDRKIWRRLIDQDGPKNRFECGEFLKAHAWLEKLKNLTVEFVWKDRKEVFGQGVSATAIGDSLVDRPIIGGQWKPIPGWNAQPSSPVRGTLEYSRHLNPDSPGVTATKPSSMNPTPDLGSEVYVAHKNHPASTGPTPNAGVFNTSVVGMKYGRMDRAALLNVGDFVKLVRESSNLHDHNAIKVIAPCGAKIGYISRHVAAHLAQGLDALGGVSQAKIELIWKQPPPHTSVSIDICFPLPPGVQIPVGLDRVAQMEDSPFAESQSLSRPSLDDTLTQAACGDSRPGDTGHLEISVSPKSVSTLSNAERKELELITVARLRWLIESLAIEQSIPWPIVGYEGGTGDTSDGTELEVAWPDYKIGIAKPNDETTAFKRRGWTIFQSESVTENDLRRIFGTLTNFEDDNIPF